MPPASKSKAPAKKAAAKKAPAAKAGSKELTTGSKAPAFAMATDGGGEVSNASLKGKAYVLYFYPRDSTPGCTREAIDFSQARKKFDAAGATVIGVSKDSVTSHDRFKAKQDLKITLASDPEIKTAEAYGVWVEKSLYGRKFMGMERTTFLVDASGKIAAIWRKVKVAGHAEAVLTAAKAL
jgi:peroxiredoxin Q/BCP